jgi:hypothetical protein
MASQLRLTSVILKLAGTGIVKSHSAVCPPPVSHSSGCGHPGWIIRAGTGGQREPERQREDGKQQWLHTHG